MSCHEPDSLFPSHSPALPSSPRPPHARRRPHKYPAATGSHDASLFFVPGFVREGSLMEVKEGEDGRAGKGDGWAWGYRKGNRMID